MKLVIIEDQTMMRQLLVMACKAEMPDAEILSAANANEGLALCEKEQPGLLILDMALLDRDGLELVPDIRKVVSEIKVLALSSHADEFTLHRVQQVGVNGFVDKSMQTFEVLKEAIDAVMSGHNYACSVVKDLKSRVRADPHAFEKMLSDREIELLGLFGHGFSNEQVAQKLGLRPNTVRNHRQNIMVKLGLSSTPQMMSYALNKGFVRMGA